MPYIGNQPGTGVRNRFIYTATASQTTFSGADNNGKTLKYADSDFVDVFLNGVCLVPVTDYTSTSKTSIVLVQAASLNDTLEVIAYDIATISDTVSKADGGTFEANVTFADGADIITATAGTDNVRLGENAGDSIASGGNNNVVIGKDAGTALTTGDDNVAVGFEALSTEDTGTRSVALGYRTLKTQNNDSTNYNVAIGYDAGLSITTGTQNVLIGGKTGDALTTGTDNVAIGRAALTSDDVGNRTVAVGMNALASQNYSTSTNSYNTAVGYAAGTAVTTGTNNTLIGGLAGDAITTGGSNTAVGAYAMTSVTDGDHNVAVGTSALDVNTSGSHNVAIGRDALGGETAGNNNIAIGYEALKLQNNTGGGNIYNNALGYNAGVAITTGGFNTLMGGFAGDVLQTGSSNIGIGYGADFGSSSSTNAITLGVNIESSSNDFSFGKASNVVKNDFDTDANWSRSSDQRLKKNITDQKLGLDFINDLRTVKYNWKANGELDASDAQLAHLRREDDDGNIINDMNTEATMHNFIAQEVKAALDTAGVSDFSGWSEDQYGVQQVSREMFVIPLVKAVQELSAKVDALETENTAIKSRLDALEAE